MARSMNSNQLPPPQRNGPDISRMSHQMRSTPSGMIETHAARVITIVVIPVVDPLFGSIMASAAPSDIDSAGQIQLARATRPRLPDALK